MRSEPHGPRGAPLTARHFCSHVCPALPHRHLTAIAEKD